jgi:Protein of unknown function (DUF2752).
MRERMKKLVCTMFLILVIGLLYILFWFKTGILLPCLFHKITGLYCPGCGVTRMCLSLLHMNFYQAFRYNAGVMVILPILILYGLKYVIMYLKGEQPHFSKVQNIILYLMIIWLVIFGVIRNIPWFSYLAPSGTLIQ